MVDLDNKEKKICIVLTSKLNNPPGGVDRFCINIYDVLKKKYNKVTLIADGTTLGCENKKIKTRKNDRPVVFHFLKKLIISALFDKNMLGNEDVVIINRSEAAILYPILNKNVRKILFIHGSSAYAELFWGRAKATISRLIERYAIYKSDVVGILLENSEYGLDYYKRKYPSFQEKMVYFPLKIDNEIINAKKRESKIKEGKIIIGYHGRITRSPKNVHKYIEISKKLCDKNIDHSIKLIGDGEDFEWMKKQVLENGLDKNFCIVGPKLGVELIEELSNIEVYVHLSRFEGICLSTLEATSMCIPVVSTNVGDIATYIDKRYGHVVSVDASTDQIIDAILAARKLKFNLNLNLKKYSNENFENSLLRLINE